MPWSRDFSTFLCGWLPATRQSMASTGPPSAFQPISSPSTMATVAFRFPLLLFLPHHRHSTLNESNTPMITFSPCSHLLQVANYCRKRIHAVLTEELRRAEDDACGSDLSGLESKKLWEKAFVDCFSRVDAEVGGNAASGAPPVAPDTVGSTAVVAVVCSSHVIVANCGDSRAVLCRGKQPLPLSLDHKVSHGLPLIPCMSN